MPNKKTKKTPKTITIAGLIVNLFLPGMGTIMLGKYDLGAIQLILVLIGFYLSVTGIGAFVGIPLIAAMWIWALIASIKAIKEAGK